MTFVAEACGYSGRGLVAFSGDGKWLAMAKETRLLIRCAETFRLTRVVTASDLIDSVAWAADSDRVATANHKRGIAEVFALSDKLWHATIRHGTVSGMTGLLWLRPDWLLTISDFRLHASVWALSDTTRQQHLITNPKFPNKTGFAITPAYFAVLERRHCKDYIGIYAKQNTQWQLLRHFPIDSYDAEEVVSSPDARVLCVRDSPLQYNLLFYSPTGTFLSSYQAYENALGIKLMTWSTSLLAVGSFDEKIRFFNTLTFAPIAELNHAISADNNHITTKLLWEKAGTSNGAALNSMKGSSSKATFANDQKHSAKEEQAKIKTCENHQFEEKSMEYANEMPIIVSDPLTKPTKGCPRFGIGKCEWSEGGCFLASRNDATPNTIWIWEIETMKLHTAIVLQHSIRAMKWNPTSQQLIFSCSTNTIYIWSPTSLVTCLNGPSEKFEIVGFRWNPDGKSVAILDKKECVLLRFL